MSANFYSHLSLLRKKISRRQFIKFFLSGIAASTFGSWLFRPIAAEPSRYNGRRKKSIKGKYDLVLASGKDPRRMTRKAIEAMGGMGRFVKRGDVVVIKPNMAWDREPEYAANTNPFVVAALVEASVAVGAKRVNIFDRTCNAAVRCYVNSGIKKAAEQKGARVYFVDEWNYVGAKFKYKSPLEDWPVFRDALQCNTFINVPVLKHHGLTGLTLSMKNLMGVCGGDRALMHSDIGTKLVNLTDFISPDLTVIDAVRVLQRHGPSGGNLEDVKRLDKVLIATDPTLADTYACTLFGKDPLSVPYIAEAVRRKFGNVDINSAHIFELST